MLSYLKQIIYILMSVKLYAWIYIRGKLEVLQPHPLPIRLIDNVIAFENGLINELSCRKDVKLIWRFSEFWNVTVKERLDLVN